MKALTISRNDPTLAHAAAKYEMRRAGLADIDFISNTLSDVRGVKQGKRLIRAHYGQRLLGEEIERESGSRASAGWAVLDFCEDPNFEVASVALIRFDARRRHESRLHWHITTWPIVLHYHTIARAMQRSLGVADLAQLAPLIFLHVEGALQMLNNGSLQVGNELRTATRAGAMLWNTTRTGGGPIGVSAYTWIAADNAAEASIRAACAACPDGRVLGAVKTLA